MAVTTATTCSHSKNDTQVGLTTFQQNVEVGYAKLGRFLSFVPFIIVVVVAQLSVKGALWGAFASAVLLMLVSSYRHTYNPLVDAVMFLDLGLTISLLGQGIVNEIIPIDYGLISPINTATMFVTALLSMVIRVPFTIQFAKTVVKDEKVRNSKGFYKLNQLVTALWVFIFLLMATSSWISYALWGDANTTGALIFGTTVPIVLPFAGAKITPFIAHYLKAKQQIPEGEMEKV